MNYNRMGAGENDILKTDFYVYSVSFQDLLSSQTQTSSIQIEADSDFQIVKLTAKPFQNLSTVSAIEASPFTVLLTDTGSGRQLMNTAVSVPSLFGSGELPFILPDPKLLYARSVLAITVSNLDSVNNYAFLQLSFIGRKVFRQGV
jgi:hypothetical protein